MHAEDVATYLPVGTSSDLKRRTQTLAGVNPKLAQSTISEKMISRQNDEKREHDELFESASGGRISTQ